MDQTNEEPIIEESQELYYKLNTPIHPAETDWTITLSRNDFPWNEIKFNDFSSKDCFDKFSSVVRDS